MVQNIAAYKLIYLLELHVRSRLIYDLSPTTDCISIIFIGVCKARNLI